MPENTRALSDNTRTNWLNTFRRSLAELLRVDVLLLLLEISFRLIEFFHLLLEDSYYRPSLAASIPFLPRFSCFAVVLVQNA